MLDKKNEKYLINNFEQVGWPDPFPLPIETTPFAFKIPIVTN